MSIISLQNIDKVYEGKGYKVEALKKVCLEVNQGDMIALMGKSGSGKSTLLNIIGCIDKATSGDYFVEGKSISSYGNIETARLRNRQFGYIVQDFALIERYSVRQNVMLPLMYTKLSRKEREKKVLDIIEQVGLKDKLNVSPNLLSGGQRQRVSIARALVNDANVILADEPTGALDSQTSEEIMNLFVEINRKGKTIIVVTHDTKVAGYCSRLFTLKDGMLSA